MLLFFVIDLCKCFLFSCFVFVYFILLICIMHSAFDLFVFPNYMFTSLFFLFLVFKYFCERAMSSPEKYHLKITIIIYYYRKPSHTRCTRSSSCTMPLLNRHAHSKATLGDHSFSFASSSVWNSIPNDVRCAPSLSSSKSRLKTYFFRSVYKD